MGIMLLDTVNSIDNVVTAIEGMGSSVASNGLAVITALLPVLAPITAAVIIANLGRKVVVRFAR